MAYSQKDLKYYYPKTTDQSYTPCVGRDQALELINLLMRTKPAPFLVVVWDQAEVESGKRILCSSVSTTVLYTLR